MTDITDVTDAFFDLTATRVSRFRWRCRLGRMAEGRRRFNTKISFEIR